MDRELNTALELYKLCRTNENDYDYELVDELGWISNREFCVWVSYSNLINFVDGLEKLFGLGLFDDGSFNANMRATGVCIDLCTALEGFLEVEDIEDIFPKEKYQH